MNKILSRRWRWAFLLIPWLIVMFWISLRAPALQGSTYSRVPSGYGAWYAYLQQQGIPVNRWQRPPEELWKEPSLPQGEAVAWQNRTPPLAKPLLSQGGAPMTLVRVANGRDKVSLPIAHQDWIKQGNVVVLLGVRSPVTSAPFSSSLPSSVGAIKVETAADEPKRPLNPLLSCSKTQPEQSFGHKS
ncbi:MAG: DUF4350 domain-containing protein [Leptolyngbyaceae cyanobacterium CSU_1_4]|nr:DUF4350 domain-containing protein [Leptolyngbyaceae cyanobacterium CSU_1_4]